MNRTTKRGGLPHRVIPECSITIEHAATDPSLARWRCEPCNVGGDLQAPEAALAEARAHFEKARSGQMVKP